MSSFLTDLFNSIFTPGPTHTLLVATNASFACLQLLLAVLFIATYSIHFIILSGLCGGLWWAINWFVAELAAAKQKEEEAERLRNVRKGKERQISPAEGSETEGETVARAGREGAREAAKAVSKELEPLAVPPAETIRKRRSLAGEMSTEDEWEKVEEEAAKDR
ncbi:MAG: hypothetical protein M1839_006293 [Geoglossum umbratile]|nr:MAG: hypothetical protein M1839_006293 [Geoglossum umbratile]